MNNNKLKKRKILKYYFNKIVNMKREFWLQQKLQYCKKKCIKVIVKYYTFNKGNNLTIELSDTTKIKLIIITVGKKKEEEDWQKYNLHSQTTAIVIDKVEIVFHQVKNSSFYKKKQ